VFGVRQKQGARLRSCITIHPDPQPPCTLVASRQGELNWQCYGTSNFPKPHQQCWYLRLTFWTCTLFSWLAFLRSLTAARC
jgi:hypothetical protein